MLKQGWIIGLVAVAATGCSTTRKPAVAPAQASTSNRSSHHGSPRFIDDISINPADSSRHSSLRHTGNRSSDMTAGPSVSTGSNLETGNSLQFKYAILLGVPVEEIDDEKLFSFIEDWYGTRYKYGGGDKEGVDCSAFSQTFMATIYGLTLPRTSAQQYLQSKRIRKDELTEGDLVFFKTRGHKAGVSHVGVYLRNNKFVHASTSGGVMINGLDDAYYAAHYAGAGRVK